MTAKLILINASNYQDEVYMVTPPGQDPVALKPGEHMVLDDHRIPGVEPQKVIFARTTDNETPHKYRRTTVEVSTGGYIAG